MDTPPRGDQHDATAGILRRHLDVDWLTLAALEEILLAAARELDLRQDRMSSP
jgi:hypothetical protein